MPTYITLGRWTQQGIESVKDSPTGLDGFKQLVKSAGGEVKGFYLVTGQDDFFVVISEAPNDDVMSKVTRATASKGGAKAQTLHAITEDEYRTMLAGLS